MNRNAPPPLTIHRNGQRPSYPTSTQQQHSFDMIQNFERKLTQYNASENVLKRWLFEILSWTASAASMGAIVGILLYCKDRPLNQRTIALAAYNVLSKFASAALILPISEAIGQLKWTWFHGSESRDIYDFEVFDKASRGAWGSFLLLFRIKGRSLAALGAILTLLLLATDTFFQQVTDYPNRWALEEVISTIASVSIYSPTYRPQYSEGWEDNSYDMETRQSMLPFMYGNGTQAVQSGNSTRPEVPLSCPASNCTWPIYNTLAVCSQCVQMDAATLLSYACMDTRINWSAHAADPMEPDWSGRVCGYFINATSDEPTLMSGYVVDNDTKTESSPGEALLVRHLPLTNSLKQSLYGGSINFRSQRNATLDVLTVSAYNGVQSVYSKQAPIVHECALTWCVKSIRSSYVWGSYREEVTAVLQNTTSGPWPWSSFQIPEEKGGGVYVTYLEDPTIEIPVPVDTLDSFTASTHSFGSSSLTAGNVMSNFDDWFPSSYTTTNISAKPALRLKNYMGVPPKICILESYPWLAPNNIIAHMERLATAVTNAMRSNLESITLVPGLAYNQKQFVVVQWGWLAFPLALLLLSLGFLIATVVRTSKDAPEHLSAWKTSAMPALIYSLPKNVQEDITSAQSSREQRRKVKVRLLPHDGWRVSGQHQRLPDQERQRKGRPPPGWI
ncbi:hypothetical protein E8E13_010804 [Curvularia kusanoi]|uniref:DUF3176 domain containing protein n=1 Tax=Curvularia kusanoi TaxID=90978 RepID=A0A9P4TJ89_CURKU|nr:hypothetical protein E8E13_010804 [Curvularia kusanoi]